MRFPLEFLFDDLSLEERPEDQLGYTLRDREEMTAVCKVVNAMNRVFHEIGQNKPDFAYMNSPLWEDVIKDADVAYKLLKANDDKYGLP